MRAGFNVIGLGEVLWDLFPGGKKLGGAPANFAYHAHALGASARVISRVGNDPLGRELLANLESLGLPSDGVSIDPAHPTGTVTVEVAPDGQPRYTIHEDVAWDHLVADEFALSCAQTADVIAFGSLAQRCAESRSAIRAMLETAKPEALRVFDVNLRQAFYSPELVADSLRLANVLKLNDSELPVLARLLGLGEVTERSNSRRFRNGTIWASWPTPAARGAACSSTGGAGRNTPVARSR